MHRFTFLMQKEISKMKNIPLEQIRVMSVATALHTFMPSKDVIISSSGRVLGKLVDVDQEDSQDSMSKLIGESFSGNGGSKDGIGLLPKGGMGGGQQRLSSSQLQHNHTAIVSIEAPDHHTLKGSSFDNNVKPPPPRISRISRYSEHSTPSRKQNIILEALTLFFDNMRPSRTRKLFQDRGIEEVYLRWKLNDLSSKIRINIVAYGVLDLVIAGTDQALAVAAEFERTLNIGDGDDGDVVDGNKVDSVETAKVGDGGNG
ncbi:hypothetical protein HDU76_005447 [Blyttiomyces sp. JEL0837]|nr:hypothetical protein HDU76_005447 [Blyttiomyces sp. JEL0837]